MRPGEVGQVQASSGLTLPHHMATRGDSALSSTISTEDSVVTGQPQSGGDTLGDKVWVAAASDRGLGMGTPRGAPASGGLAAHPPNLRTQPRLLQPCSRHAQQVPAPARPPGDRPQVLARRVLVRVSVTVVRLRRRDPAHRPR